MAKQKSPDNSSDREKKWDKLFRALVKLSKNLNADRQILVDRIKSLNEVIFQMKMEQNYVSAKFDLMLGFKERDAIVYKSRYDNADDQLSDFKEWFVILSQKNSEPKDTSENEVRRLKSELEKCISEKESDISALLDEKKFVWNQYGKMESDLTEKFRKKCNEVELANEKVQVLVNRAEELQSSNERLRTDLTKMESDSLNKSREISQLLKEMEKLKSKLDSETPTLRNCTAEAGPSNQRGMNGTLNGKVRTVAKESDPKMAPAKPSAHKSTGGKAPMKQLCIKDRSNLKRKSANILTIRDDTPKLWTSSSKAPKLKRTT